MSKKRLLPFVAEYRVEIWCGSAGWEMQSTWSSQEAAVRERMNMRALGEKARVISVPAEMP